MTGGPGPAHRSPHHGMQALFYDRPCPAQGCQYHAALDGTWLICAGGHRMEARRR